MEEKKRFKVYKMIMLIVLVAFITFLCTSIGMYQIFINSNLEKSSILATKASNSDTKKLLTNTI